MSTILRGKFQNFCQKSLNPEQFSAVNPRTGFFVVRAGAGSGKTRVITARIIHLMLEYEVPASAIIALTFTNKAAREMRERVLQMMPPDSALPVISTFHAYSLQLLKRYGHHIGLDRFTVLDSSDRDKLLQGLIKKHPRGRKITAAQLGAAISRHKNGITTLSQINMASWEDPLLHELFRAYESERKIQHSLDFDDLLLELLRLVQSSRTCKEQLQSYIQHILIDEYQDTNKLQHTIVTEFAYRPDGSNSLQSLCIVGDENQSIYSWRGATVDNMGACIRQFPAVATIAITQNYRSVQPILQVANHIIRNNHAYTPHTIWSDRAAHDRVRLLTCYSSQQEAELIALCATYFQRSNGLNKLAILYRSHFQSRAIEEALVRYSIPYKIIGGIQFYDRQEIKDLLAYLRLSVNPFDRISFTRCINTPSRALGDVFVEQFMELWQTDAAAPYNAIAHLILHDLKLPPRKIQALQDFLMAMEQIDQATDIRAALDGIITHTKFITHLTNAYEPAEAKERIANVHELLAAVTAAIERGTTTLSQFLDEIALLIDHTDEQNVRGFVQLMTLHSAKGLEFDTVILPGLEETVFPSTQACLREEALEEERRLLYVGITRAREKLLITRTLSRYMYGTVHDQLPSRFLEELPPQYVRFTDCARMYPRELNQDIEQWLQGHETRTTSVPASNYEKCDHVKQPSIPRSSQALSKQGPAHRPHAAPTRTNALSEPQALTNTHPNSWEVRDRVHHTIFGTGIVINIEGRMTGSLITVQFTTGAKKIQSRFLTKC